jgi:hypothetical protein
VAPLSPTDWELIFGGKTILLDPSIRELELSVPLAPQDQQEQSTVGGTSRTHYNVAGVALANKLPRMAWAVLATGKAYRAPPLAAALV